MASGQPMCVWLVNRPGEALEIVEGTKQRAWGQLYLHLSKHHEALPGLCVPGLRRLGHVLPRARMSGCVGFAGEGSYDPATRCCGEAS